MSIELMWKNAVLILFGISSGIAVSCGVFTVFTAVGLVPRFADKINGAKHILVFENMIMLGVFCGCMISIYEPMAFHFSRKLLLYVSLKSGMAEKIVSAGQQIIIRGYALFTGCYVSCLALSIAELFDAIPIMARRIRLKRGLGIMILAFAVGKLTGSLIYYYNNFFNY